MTYNNYEFKMIRKDDATKEIWYAWGCGTTAEEAIAHTDFWNADGDRLAEDFEIIEIKVEGTTTEYPYEEEDMLKRASADKEEAIRRIEAAEMWEKDKQDLKRVVINEDPAAYNFLATACRDWFWTVME